MRRTMLIPLALIALVLPVSSATAGPSATSAACGSVQTSGGNFLLAKQGVKCRFARRWVRRLTNSGGANKPDGFRCTSGSGFKTGGQCFKKGNQQVYFLWHPGD